MSSSKYQLQFANLSGLDVVGLQKELGPDAQEVHVENVEGHHRELGLAMVAIALTPSLLSAALLYLARNTKKATIELKINIVKPDGTTITIEQKFDLSEKEALPEKVLAQIAKALDVDPSEFDE